MTRVVGFRPSPQRLDELEVLAARFGTYTVSQTLARTVEFAVQATANEGFKIPRPSFSTRQGGITPSSIPVPQATDGTPTCTTDSPNLLSENQELRVRLDAALEVNHWLHLRLKEKEQQNPPGVMPFSQDRPAQMVWEGKDKVKFALGAEPKPINPMDDLNDQVKMVAQIKANWDYLCGRTQTPAL
jgi:hypothetical protein